MIGHNVGIVFDLRGVTHHAAALIASQMDGLLQPTPHPHPPESWGRVFFHAPVLLYIKQPAASHWHFSVSRPCFHTSPSFLQSTRIWESNLLRTALHCLLEFSPYSIAFSSSGFHILLTFKVISRWTRTILRQNDWWRFYGGVLPSVEYAARRQHDLISQF